MVEVPIAPMIGAAMGFMIPKHGLALVADNLRHLRRVDRRLSDGRASGRRHPGRPPFPIRSGAGLIVRASSAALS